MRNIHLIKFSFGTNLLQDIPKEQIEYFSSFFSVYFNTEYSYNESISERYKTIPISYKKIANNTDILAKKLIKYLCDEYHIIDSKKKFNKTDDLVIVDIKSNFRDTALLYLSSEIEALLNLDLDNNSPRFILIIENIPALLERFSSISNFIKLGKVLLIDKKKRFKYKDDPLKVNKDFSFDPFTKSSLDKTKFKLIRKIGHYGRYKDTEKVDLIACNQFFYDGRDCISDICDLLFNKIVTLKEDELFNTSKVIFGCSESPWLNESILLLDSDLKDLAQDYGFIYSESINIKDVCEISCDVENILFVVDLIHTGEVFKKKYKFLKGKYPNSRIKAITILISDIENKFLKIKDEKAELVITEDEKISVDYLLLVKQSRYESFEKCPICKELHMEIIKDSSYINEDVLTSFEAWTMCDEAGYITEDFATERPFPYPKVIPLKPHSLKLIKENSAYLALKYVKYIEKYNLLDSPDLILVFPDETKNINEIGKRKTPIQIEETPSGYFAETLLQLKEFEYFGIPRDIIDKIIIKEDLSADLTFIKNDYNEFYSKLRLLSDDIIIMDEFGFSGGTLEKIILILDTVKKKPKAYFPIFNFNPQKINNKNYDYQVLSLYDFTLK